MVIKNYSGDIMNFGLSADLAEMDDIEVAQVIVKDDVAVPDREEGTGRRGIAGTVFVHKIAGAKAEQGASLAEVKAAAEKGSPQYPYHGCCHDTVHSSGSWKAWFSDRRRRDRDRHGNPW